MKITILICMILILLMSTFFLNFILKGFNLKRERFLVFLWPIFMYVAGFCLRLSENIQLVDLGYFLTGFSVLFVSLIWTTGVILGQIKYHGLKN